MSCWSEVVFFILGFSVIVILLQNFIIDKSTPGPPKHSITTHFETNDLVKSSFSNLYNESLQQKLFKEVKVLCWVMTHPDNYKTRSWHIKNTWGKRCNKLLFMSSSYDPDLPTIDLKIPVGRQNLWLKTKAAFQFAYDHHLNEYDWFMRADDDNYIVVENLRHLLYQYNPSDSLYIGHRFSIRNRIEYGYMAGGGFILSKAALKALIEKVLPTKKNCQGAGSGIDDLLIGECLKDHAVFVDARDEHHQKRFYPIGVQAHMKKDPDLSSWYYHYLYYNASQGNLECCSDTYVGSHYVYAKEAYVLDYLIYHVHPFGIDKPNELPRKLNFEDVKKAGEVPPFQQEIWRKEDEEKRREEQNKMSTTVATMIPQNKALLIAKKIV